MEKKSLKFCFLCIAICFVQIGCDSDDSIETVWVERYAGIQCQGNDFNTVEEASRHLLINEIVVYEEITREVATCEACDICPSGPLFLFLIDETKKRKAVGLGWSDSDGPLEDEIQEN